MGAPKGGKIMKKAIKLLSLAMLFAMPLAACDGNKGGNGGNNSGSGDNGGSGDEGGGSGGGGSSLTAKGEATRIAAEIYEIDEDEVTFADYEDEEAEADVYKYETSKLSFYMTGYLDDSMSYDEMVSNIKSFMPSGAKKNSTYSYGKQDLSEDGITYIYFDEVYTKDGMAYNVIVDYYEDDEYGIDASASICVLKESQLAAYAEYFDSEGDDDWDDDDDWEDDDDDDEGAEIVHKGTKSDPYTVSDALAFIATLEDDEYSDEKFVTGKVVEITNWSSAGRPTFTMGTASNILTVWSANALPGASGQNWLKANDTVVVSGALVNFKGNTPEMTYVKNGVSCSVVSVNGSTGGGGGGGQQDDDEGGGGGGGTVVGDSVVINFSSVSGTSGSVGGISFESSKAGGQADPAYKEKELRLYAKNTITISGAQMSQIVFTANTCGHDKTTATIASASTGKVNGNTWTGSASSVTFTISDKGQFHISSISISASGAGGGSGDEGGGGSGGGQVADLENYAKELSYNVFEEEDGYELLEDGSYYVGVYWEEEGAMSLVEACEDAYNYTPEDFVLANDPEEDGDMAYMICATEDESVCIEIDSYLEDDDEGVTWICIDYFIYEAE